MKPTIPELDVGDRVAVAYDEDDHWQVGTIVLKRGRTLFDVLEDNGTEDTWDFRDYAVVKLHADTGRYSKRLKKVDVQRMLAKGATSKINSLPEEKMLVEKLGDHKLFLRCATDKSSLKKYIMNVWHAANSTFFGNRLKPPNLVLLPDNGDRQMKRLADFRRQLNGWFRVKRGGEWVEEQFNDTAGRLRVRQRIFSGTEGTALVTLVHEMCHQAAFEIDHDYSMEEQGHGPTWRKWMVHCGLPPARYADKHSMMQVLDGLDHDQKREHLDKLVKGEILTRREKGTPCKFRVGNDWVLGVLVCAADKKGKKWAVLTDPVKGKYKQVPWTDLYEFELQDRLPRDPELYLRPMEQLYNHFQD